MARPLFPVPSRSVPRRIVGRRTAKVFIVLAAIYAAWCIALYLGQRWLVFPNYALAGATTQAALDPRIHTLTRRAVDGVGVAWYVPARSASASRPAPLVVFIHGNSHIIDELHERVAAYGKLGCNVLLPEYRGYGRSTGEPSERAILDDALYFLDQVSERPEVDRGRIVLHGASLGGTIAAQLARQRGAKALILDSAFSSLPAAGSRLLLIPQGLIDSSFRLDEVLPTLDIPVLLLHGTQDWIVSDRSADELCRLARNAKVYKFACGHQQFPCDGEKDEYWSVIERFLRSAGVLSP